MGLRLSRFWLWLLPLSVAIAGAALLGTGFVLALRGAVGEPIGEPPPPPSRHAAARSANAGAFRILVLGDSLARGTGDETGKGFAVNVLEAFRKDGPAEITNLGVKGMESPEIQALVETANVRGLAADADLILLSAGANDLSHAVTRATASPADVADSVAAARARYVQSLRGILAALREANTKALICVLGLYDPFGNEAAGQGRIGASVILQWNTLASETALSFPNVFVVPTFDLFQGRPDRLGADHYHPNARAYEEIAVRVLQVVQPDPAPRAPGPRPAPQPVSGSRPGPP